MLVGFGVALQLVPLGAWRHSNPPVISQAVFADPDAEALAAGACLDCHSHQTRYPLYSYVAPMSWLIQRDIELGRDEMNLSDWDPDDGEDAAETIIDGEMPPRRYTLLHPEARLSDSERETLARAFAAMAGRGGVNRGARQTPVSAHPHLLVLLALPAQVRQCGVRPATRDDLLRVRPAGSRGACPPAPLGG